MATASLTMHREETDVSRIALAGLAVAVSDASFAVLLSVGILHATTVPRVFQSIAGVVMALSGLACLARRGRGTADVAHPSLTASRRRVRGAWSRGAACRDAVPCRGARASPDDASCHAAS